MHKRQRNQIAFGGQIAMEKASIKPDVPISTSVPACTYTCFGFMVGFLALMLTSGCSPQECVSTERFFNNEVWAPILSAQCIQCHNAQGEAKESKFVLQESTQTGFLEANFEIVKNIAAFQIEGQSLLLAKPLTEVDHEGGVRFDKGSKEHKALQALIEQFESPVTCELNDLDNFFQGVQTLDNQEALRKASLNLTGRLPTDAEFEEAQQSDDAMRAVVEQMMQEEAFLDRLKEIYNDMFLTDRYLPGADGVNLLSGDDFPDRRWYDDISEADVPDASARNSMRNQLRSLTNQAVAREPLELIAHVVRNNRPFTEILTADYILVNPFSARTYGVAGDGDYALWQDPNDYDATAFREARIPEQPHAGVLTSPMFLNRFPTTATNVNRARSRVVYQFFLATDVLKLAERPVDPTQIQDHNPTMHNAGCTVCHAVIDPIAGTFLNWDERGRYRPPENGWVENLRPPGFADKAVPSENLAGALPWLGQSIAEDSRFATSVIHTLFTALTGNPPLSGAVIEGLNAEDTAAHQSAFEVQNKILTEVREAFVADNYRLQTAVWHLIQTPYFRAKTAEFLPAARAQSYKGIGHTPLLTPERLDRRIEAVLGIPWERNGTRELLSSNRYRMFYGGIDSDAITRRITSPNGVMASIQGRMAAEMACRTVPWEFVLPPEQRLLFADVEMSFQPEDANGFEIVSAVDAIRKNIDALYLRVLGYHPSMQEQDEAYEIFYQTWKEGQALLNRTDEEIEAGATTLSEYLDWQCRARENPLTGESLDSDARIERDPNYVVRSWMAVVTYLLADFQFIYQ